MCSLVYILQLEQEKAQKEKDNITLDTEIEKLNDAYAKLSKERKALEDKLQVWWIGLLIQHIVLNLCPFYQGHNKFSSITRRQGQPSKQGQDQVGKHNTRGTTQWCVYMMDSGWPVYLQTQDDLSKEKQCRADVEKARRKLEAEFKSAQSNVEELTKHKQEMERSIARYVCTKIMCMVSKLSVVCCLLFLARRRR